MNKTEYLIAFGRALMRRGMTKEAAETNMRIISFSVNEDSLSGRSDEDIKREIERLADGVTLVLTGDPSEKKPNENMDSKGIPSSVPGTVLPEYVSPDSVIPVDFNAENVPRGDEIDELVGKTKSRRIRDEKPIPATSSGISGANAKVGLFAASYVLTVILRIVCVVLLIAVTISGVALFAVGIVYGISQLFTFKGAAYFEIGLSFIIGGVFVALGVMLYNSIGNFIPKLQKWIKKRIRNIKSRIKDAKYRMEKRGRGA
ncbi:MAG: hypothetical protein IKN50_02885 [Clostridia bacterium]|nr:hypothetical protein [Clostridia bacterium]